MKIISLNTHGLSDFSKFRRILSKLRFRKPDIILLQETFTLSTNPPTLPSIIAQWQSIWNGAIYLSNHLAILIPSHIPSQHIATSTCNRIMDVSVHPPNSSPFIIRNIYDPAQPQLQPHFWDSLPSLLPNTKIISGDFNFITQPHDHTSS